MWRNVITMFTMLIILLRCCLYEERNGIKSGTSTIRSEQLTLFFICCHVYMKLGHFSSCLGGVVSRCNREDIFYVNTSSRNEKRSNCFYYTFTSACLLKSLSVKKQPNITTWNLILTKFTGLLKNLSRSSSKPIQQLKMISFGGVIEKSCLRHSNVFRNFSTP